MANQIILRPWGHYIPLDHSLTRIKLNSNQTTELSRKISQDVSLVITQGQCDLIIGDRTIKLSRGEYYFITNSTWYQLSNTNDTACKLIEITHES